MCSYLEIRTRLKVFELDESERSSAMFDSPSCPSFGKNGAELKINITSGVVHLTPGMTYQGFQELYDIFANKSESRFYCIRHRGSSDGW